MLRWRASERLEHFQWSQVSPKNKSCRGNCRRAKNCGTPRTPHFGRALDPKIKKIVRNERLLIEYCIIHRYHSMSCDWMPATRRKSRHSPSPGRRAATVAPDPTSLDGLCRPVVSASSGSTHWMHRFKRCFLFARRATLRASTSDPARIGASTRR